MKERVKNFLSNNSINIPVYISLACIGIWNSTIALVVYAVIMHILLLLFIIALYYPIITKQPITGFSAKRVLFMVTHISITIIILVVTKHWYILCISMLSAFLGFVHMYDLIKNISVNGK